MEDEYNCMTDLMPTDPKKLVEQLTKIETKLKEVTSEISKEDRQSGKGHPDTQKESNSHKKRVITKANRMLFPIFQGSQHPRKPTSFANYVKNMVVLKTLIILLGARNGLQATKHITNGKAKEPLTSMSIRMLVSNKS